MARPPGHRLNRHAFDDVLRLTGRSLTDVAQGADIARPTLSGLRSGNHAASVPVAHRLAAALGVHPATLFPTIAAAEAPAEAVA